jgi:hypothetical protein
LKYPSPLYLLLLSAVFSSCKIHLTKCEELNTYEIPPYKLIKKRCIGPVGPPYFPVALYKGSKFLGEHVFTDSCLDAYQVSNGLYLKIDLCQETFTEIRPDKKKIDGAGVDSMHMFSTEKQQTKSFLAKQAATFIEDWNKSEPVDYREDPVDSIFFPNYDYKLTLFTKSGKREFLTGNNQVSERTHWVYYITEEESVEYFKNLWGN